MRTELAAGGLVSDIGHLFDYQFMVNALVAGTLVAVAASSVGWFMVVRRQTFAGHTLSLVAFPGASAAALAGAPAFVGYFAACALGALLIAAATGGALRSISQESAAIGSVQAVALGAGFVFVSLYHGVLNSLNSLLFGSFLGIGSDQVRVTVAVTAVSLAALAAMARPLLFASVDAEVAAAAGVPVRALSAAFMLLLGLSVGATSQITGALLVFALLVTPAATAQALTSRSGLSFALSLVLAVAVTWAGLAIAYYSIYPVGFWVTSLSFGLYVLARAARRFAR